MNQLLAQNLGKRFGSELVFRDLSFRLGEGMILGITGANGSGKSTLLRILAGVVQPSAGNVVLQVDDEGIVTDDRPLHTGFIAPYFQLYRAFSGRENLRFQARMRGMEGANYRIARVLDRVGLADRADDLLSTYSSGMYQRLRLASALLTEPAVLLLDEPFSNLDEVGRKMVDTVLERQRERGTLQAMATNSARYTGRCDEIVCMEDFKS